MPPEPPTDIRDVIPVQVPGSNGYGTQWLYRCAAAALGRARSIRLDQRARRCSDESACYRTGVANSGGRCRRYPRGGCPEHAPHRGCPQVPAGPPGCGGSPDTAPVNAVPARAVNVSPTPRNAIRESRLVTTRPPATDRNTLQGRHRPGPSASHLGVRCSGSPQTPAAPTFRGGPVCRQRPRNRSVAVCGRRDNRGITRAAALPIRRQE